MSTLLAILALATSPAPTIEHRRIVLCDRQCVYDRHRRRVIRPYRGWLRSTRQCESGGNYAINTGNGFYGAYQFTESSWRLAGGRGMPHHATRLEQDYRAVRLLHIQGRGAWPVCG